ncbi:hypothetical protein CLV59_1012 [Chitinophaga dinghuensis]|uniref:Outer membrane protein with beta-barrel domain n=1 Tax=Chitinophaga dinghuensis TaxID=1539050 RepID=A0A327W9L5_9BACT|nr:hypothetical protein [Chitinophaga dinghuensis]RAJ87253.1 hypothetical protein CLV59_1012 [Chitinophaga dinghuensis]
MRQLKILAAASLILTAACRTTVYVPSPTNAPALKEKHEFKATVGPNSIQTAFAITDHLAIMANGQYVYRSNLFSSDGQTQSSNGYDRYVQGGSGEAAIGYFLPIKDRGRKSAIFDVYAGYGTGGFNTLDRNYDKKYAANANDYKIETRFSKFFIQPSIGIVHPVVETIFSSRISLVNFYGLHAGSRATPFDSTYSDKGSFYEIGARTRLLYEPAITVRLGYKYGKFQMQLQHSLSFSGDNDHNFTTYFEPLSFNVGATLDIAKWYHSKTKQLK